MQNNRGYGLFGIILAIIVFLAMMAAITGENEKTSENQTQMSYDEAYESIVGEEEPTE